MIPNYRLPKTGQALPATCPPHPSGTVGSVVEGSRMPAPPVYTTDLQPIVAPQRMPVEERATYRAAACRAIRLYPGPVGELISRELHTFVEFGWRLDFDSLLTRLRDDILRQTGRPRKD